MRTAFRIDIVNIRKCHSNKIIIIDMLITPHNTTGEVMKQIPVIHNRALKNEIKIIIIKIRNKKKF